MRLGHEIEVKKKVQATNPPNEQRHKGREWGDRALRGSEVPWWWWRGARTHQRRGSWWREGAAGRWCI